jgi:hypothetical protein
MNAALREWLLDGGPRPEDADALLAADPEASGLARDLASLDAAVAALPLLRAPPDLSARTLAAALSVPQDPPEVANRPFRRWFAVSGALLLVAAMMLLAVGLTRPAPSPEFGGIGDPSAFVPRGAPSNGHVGLRIAVQRDGVVSRLDDAPKPGDNLLFRYDVDRAGSLHLLQFTSRAAKEIGRTNASPGTADFPSDAGLLAWEVDAGDPPSVFALVGCPVDPSQIHPGDPTDPRSVCAALRDAGCSCDAVAVEGSP